MSKARLDEHISCLSCVSRNIAAILKVWFRRLLKSPFPLLRSLCFSMGCPCHSLRSPCQSLKGPCLFMRCIFLSLRDSCRKGLFISVKTKKIKMYMFVMPSLRGPCFSIRGPCLSLVSPCIILIGLCLSQLGPCLSHRLLPL